MGHYDLDHCVHYKASKQILSTRGVTLSFAEAHVLYNSDNFGIMSIKTDKWPYFSPDRYQVESNGAIARAIYMRHDLPTPRSQNGLRL